MAWVAGPSLCDFPKPPDVGVTMQPSIESPPRDWDRRGHGPRKDPLDITRLPSSPVLDRLWPKVAIGAFDECWPFTGYQLKGYGRIGLGSRVDGVGFANRVVAEACHGPAPSSQHQARHLCGNSACCNPAHIAWGTQSDNEMDKVAHGRSNRGSRHGMSKLTADQVRAIRERATRGQSQGALAYWFGVTQQTVSDIVNRRTWSWLDTEDER